jgi:hypothetical protein
MTPGPQQLEFASFAFPKDRTVLYVAEVAMKLRVTEQHVLDLIEEGQSANLGGNDRQFWRVSQLCSSV